jgi:hypothetical protein
MRRESRSHKTVMRPKGRTPTFFTPHPVKPLSSPASLREAGRAEQEYRGASKYLPQRKPRVLIRGAGFTLFWFLYHSLTLLLH